MLHLTRRTTVSNPDILTETFPYGDSHTMKGVSYNITTLAPVRSAFKSPGGANCVVVALSPVEVLHTSDGLDRPSCRSGDVGAKPEVNR